MKRRNEDKYDQRRRNNNKSEDDDILPIKKTSIGIVDKTETFQIFHDCDIKEGDFETTHVDLQNVNVYDPDRMLKGGFCTEEDIKRLFNQKTRMDRIFDSGDEHFYYEVRDKLFPQDRKGSSKFRNRAGDKLNEVDEAVHIFPEDSIIFLDICGGPGAFSQLLLDKKCQPIGYGITLKCDIQWYRELENNIRFTICNGADGTGNIYVPQNLESVVEKIQTDNQLSKLNICVADGGFEIKRNEKGEHMENYQELFSGHIILSELLLTMKALQPGGHFICKLFDAFSSITQSLIYITSQLFAEVYLVKPFRSRIVNSERYLVGKSLMDKSKDRFQFLQKLLEILHRQCTENMTPLSVIPLSILRGDKKFMESASKACEEICQRQSMALELVMDEVENRIKEKKKNGTGKNKDRKSYGRRKSDNRKKDRNYN